MSTIGQWKKGGALVPMTSLDDEHLKNSLRYIYRRIGQIPLVPTAPVVAAARPIASWHKDDLEWVAGAPPTTTTTNQAAVEPMAGELPRAIGWVDTVKEVTEIISERQPTKKKSRKKETPVLPTRNITLDDL